MEDLLACVHDASGSTITANSRRLCSLRNAPDALEICRGDVKAILYPFRKPTTQQSYTHSNIIITTHVKHYCTDNHIFPIICCTVKADILKYTHVTLEAKAECVHRYATMADVKMHVCGTCGIRDIFDPYSREVVLSDVNDEHWLIAGKEAYSRLTTCDELHLLKPDNSGGYEVIHVKRSLLHSVVEVDGRVYHVVPESIMDGNKIKLCKRCARGWDNNIVAKRAAAPDAVANTDFEDMYATNAPVFSIAHGDDFGRLSGLRSRGVRTDVSTMERLVLAEARCHQIVYKVVANAAVTERRRLHGHSIVCPQRAVGYEHKGFGRAALEAAYAVIRIVFVGPSGVQGKLEQSALKIEDLRLRPDVIYNFLSINNLLHNGTSAPTIDEIGRLIADHSLALHIKEHARIVIDTEIEEASAASDIANVRSHAQSNEQRLTNEDPMEDLIPEDDALPPNMVPIGLFESNPQPMEAVIKGISRIFTEGEGGNGDDNPVPDALPQESTGSMYLQRGNDICRDYGGAADIIYKTWWPLMPLRRGFVKNASIPDSKMRQVFLYFDNRFAHDMSFVFHAANMMMRHAVNRAVTARVKTSPEAFAKFTELVHDGNFLQMLEDARADPKGKTAREVVSKVIGFINLSAGKIPWGSRERASELGKLIADTRYAGPSSIFYSVSPDDVHNDTTIRLATPHTSCNSFPAQVDPGFYNALRGGGLRERMAYAPDGLHTLAMDETSLQLLAAKNPVACAMAFEHLVRNVRGNLIGLANDRLKDDLISDRRIGQIDTTIADIELRFNIGLMAKYNWFEDST